MTTTRLVDRKRPFEATNYGQTSEFSRMLFLFLFIFLMTSYGIEECRGHVALTYPPARDYGLDFLDNFRTPAPCGMPKGVKRTSLMSGSIVNVTWHLAYPHQGGYKLELLNSDGKPWMDLTPATGSSGYVKLDATAHQHPVRLPESLSCAGCTIRLQREAIEWADNYTLWSCADVDIVKPGKYAENCFGHGEVHDGTCRCHRRFFGQRCQFEDECSEDNDCGEHGKCVDIDATSYPKKQCYCQLGWFGQKCKTESVLKSTNLDLKKHHRKDLSEDFTLFWKILKSQDEIEIVLRVKTVNYVSIGWRPKGTNSDCKAFPLIDDHLASRTELEGIADAEPEPEVESTADQDASQTKHETTSKRNKSPVSFTPHRGNATEVYLDEERLIEGTAEAIPYDDEEAAQILEGRTVKKDGHPAATTKADVMSEKLLADRLGTATEREETGAESKGHIVTLDPSPSEAEGHRRISAETDEPSEQGEVNYGFDENQKDDGQVEYSFNVHTTTTVRPWTESTGRTRQKRQSKSSSSNSTVERSPKSITEREPDSRRTYVQGPYTPKLDFHPMDCTDIVTGMVHFGSYSRVRDQYTRDRSTPRDDDFWGGRDSLTAAGGFEEDGTTTVFFRRKLAAADDTDHSIVAGQMHVIWAKGQEHGSYVHSPPSGLEINDQKPSDPEFYRTDEFKYHGHRSQRGIANIDFFDEAKHPRLTGKGHGEFKFPPSCSVDDCEYRATWELVPSKDEITFTVSTNNTDKWTGIGFSEDTKMPGTDAILGWVDDSGRTFVMDTWIDGYTTPILDESQDVIDFRGSKIDGRVTLIFKRKRNTGDTKNDLQFSDTNCLYLVFPHNGGVFNAVNKKIRQHTATPIVSEAKICIEGTSTSNEEDQVSSTMLVTLSDGTMSTSSTAAPAFVDAGSAASVTPTVVSTTPKTLSEYLVAIRLPNQTLGDAVERGIDFEMLIMEHLKAYMTDALNHIEGFEKVDVIKLESEKNESRVVAKLRIHVDADVGHPVSGPRRTAELRRALNETIAKGRVGRLVVDPFYLTIQPPPELAEDFGVSVDTKFRERGADNEKMLLYVLVAAVSALVFLLVVLIVCTICRSRSARKARISKERLIAAGGWKDYAAAHGTEGYGYENFGVNEETPRTNKKHAMHGGGGTGSANGTPRGSSGHHPKGNHQSQGHSETKSLHRNSRGVIGAQANNDRHYSRRSESLPRPMGGPSSSGAVVDRSNDFRSGGSRPSSATSLHPQGQLQPDFYFMPSQRRYSGEVVRVYVDYNNPNYTGK